MSTQTQEKPPTTLLGPWLVWGAASVVTLLILVLLAMWLVPRFAPVWVATHSPFFVQVLYAVERESATPGVSNTDAADVALYRMWVWDRHAAGVLRRRLEAAPATYDGMLEANLLQVMCERTSIRVQAAEHMSPVAAEAWADRYRENQRDDLLAAGLLLVRSPQLYHQRAGINCLGDLGDRRALPDVEAHLSHPEEWMARIAREAVERIGDPASIPALCQTMMRSKDSHPMEYLATIDRMEVTVPEDQLAMILGHPSRFVRLWALNRLGAQRTATSFSALARLAADEDERVAMSARTVLMVGINAADIESLLGLLRSDDKLVGSGSALVLSALGNRRAVPPLLDLLVRTEGFIEPAVEAALLACLPADSDAELQAGFVHRSGTVRAWIARRIGVRRLPDAPAFLLAHVEDPEPQVRAAIYRALGELHVREVLPRLRQALASDVMVERVAAIRALGDLQDPTALRALSELLQAKERRLRQAAAQALGELGDPAAMPELRRVQNDPEPAVREAVRQALEHLSGDAPELRAVEGRRLQEFVEPVPPPTVPEPSPTP